MKRITFIEFQQTLISKVVFFHILSINFSANEYHICFFKSSSSINFARCQTCFLCLIAISSGMRTAEAECASVFFTEKRDCKKFIFFNKLKCLSIGTYHCCKHRHIPENSRLSPRSGHGIVFRLVSAGKKKPVLTDKLVRIKLQIVYIRFNKTHKILPF